MRVAMAVAGLTVVAVPSLAQTGRITNVAQAFWSAGGTVRSVASNMVAFTVDTAPVGSLTTYRSDPTAPALPYRPSTCRRADGGGSGDAATAPAAVARGLTVADAVHAGETLAFELAAPAAVRDTTAIGRIAVTPTTGVATGRFVGELDTRAAAPPTVAGNCMLELGASDEIRVAARVGDAALVIPHPTIEVLADPFGLLFDSEDGTPISDARVTMIDVATGQPAAVFAPDGVTPWPSTIVTGQTVIDGGGNRTTLPPGEYWFPLARPGEYRLEVEPPAPYTAPSTTTVAQLAGLSRPGGAALALGTASFGASFVLTDAAPVRIDVPLDRPAVAVGLTKTASRTTAAPGDVVLYTVTIRNPDASHAKRDVVLVDTLPPAMRLRSDAIRIDGVADLSATTIAPDGGQLTIRAGTLAAGGSRTIVYALEVRPEARDGQAVNRALATDARGLQTAASAAVRIVREGIADRMTLIGRVLDGACGSDGAGVPGVRMMLEDGSYAVTDADGRYHFEALVPGTHVVEADAATLPAGAAFVDCARSTRSAGSATSRFVEGQGGSLAVAEFRIARGKDAASAAAHSEVPIAASDKEAAGGERDWFTGGTPDIAWLFPEPDYNPRSPAIRVAIRHLPGQTVALTAEGKPVDRITLDGTRQNAAKTFAVTLWRGVPLTAATTHLAAIVRNADGTIARTLTRDVAFTVTPARAELLIAKSRLVADSVRPPVLAVRFTDRNGRPVHQGVVGAFALSAPYEVGVADDAQQARMLSKLAKAAPTWRVAGDDGIAYIPLVPTSTSGALTLDFTFRDRDQARTQRIEAWLSPGQRDWTIVGLAEGRIGRHALGDHVEPLARPTGDVTADGRVAFYAKGRILGKWLLTAAFDTDKKRADQRLGGTIDPNTYYTVYADRSERRYDAASMRKLYLRLEGRQFYALFGDFVTGFDETELGQYARAGTGVKAEFRNGHVKAAAFAARFDTAHRRDEIQGNGLSGPYGLSARDIAANSERVVIEVRDRLRSEKIVEQRTLVRFADYDIDYAAGTIRFKAPVLSRSSALDPQFIVVDYELLDGGAGAVNAGARASWRTADDRLRVGATALRDKGDGDGTTIGAVDARLRIGRDTEVRAEAGASRASGHGTDIAWLAEVEHHDRVVDMLAYARQQGSDYGVQQQNLAERGRRKIGADGRVRIGETLSLAGSAWADDDLDGAAQRRVARARLEYRTTRTELRVGVTYAADHTIGGEDATSTLLEGGATRRMLGGRLELDAATSVALGKAASVDFPVQHRIGARFQLTPGIALIGSYEIADGSAIDARTARIGFDVAPWQGAKLTSSFGSQAISEYGPRAFAAYGLAQSLPVGRNWSIDATLDGNKTLGGIDVARLVNPAQPAASGGYVGTGNLVTEDFTAATLGATYRAGDWSATGRAEYRLGQLGDRQGVTLGVIKQLGAGSVAGGLATWTHAEQPGGATTGTLEVAVSAATRPDDTHVALLGKIEWREDRVENAQAGLAGPIGGAPLTVTGDAVSRRVVGNASLNWSPEGYDADGRFQRTELMLFVGGRYVFDRLDALDLHGLSTLVGLDARLGLGPVFEIAVSGTVRGNLADGAFGYAAGPTIGYRPAANMLVSVGYNVHGFADRDFAAARQTRQGPFVDVKIKLDRTTLAWLGVRSR